MNIVFSIYSYLRVGKSVKTFQAIKKEHKYTEVRFELQIL